MAPPRPRQPPDLMAELVEEILLRVPPDGPAGLVRASLVCKAWRRLLLDPAFRRRYRAFHRVPPQLGFFHHHHTVVYGVLPRFVPTVTPSPFPQRAFVGCQGWRVLDCRHGRVLFDTSFEGVNFVVWYPTTGKRQWLPKPQRRLGGYNAAVLCAVRGCDHLDCRDGPFFVVLVGYCSAALGLQLYSSEAGAWNASVGLGPDFFAIAADQPSVIIGDDIYFVLIIPRDRILKYSLGNNCLSIIHPPEAHENKGGIALMPMEDESLGLATVLSSKLCVWSRSVDREVVAGWVQFRVIDLQTLIPLRYNSKVTGSAEGFAIIFVATDVGVFTIDLRSGQVRKVGKPWECYVTYPS